MRIIKFNRTNHVKVISWNEIHRYTSTKEQALDAYVSGNFQEYNDFNVLLNETYFL
jgi:hypothetical protein